MDEVSGADGELIDRLFALLGASSQVDADRAYNCGWMIATSVGGDDRFYGSEPIRERSEPPRPGSIAAIKAKSAAMVTMTEWLDMIRDRLVSLVSLGVSEAFLVQALRDELTNFYSQRADIDQTNKFNEETRLRIEASAEDPFLAERWQGVSADDMRAFAGSSMLAPIDADSAKERWGELEAWSKDVEVLLDDDTLRAWTHERARLAFDRIQERFGGKDGAE